MTGHVADRLAGRIASEDRASVERAIGQALAACDTRGIRDAAIRVWRATSKRMSEDGSNGDCVVLLVRGGHAATVMLRRHSQPHTTTAYATERVLCVRGTCDRAEHARHV